MLAILLRPADAWRISLLNRGEDFDRKIVVKGMHVESRAGECIRAGGQASRIANGHQHRSISKRAREVTDSRRLIEALSNERTFSILTKSTLVLRDLDLLGEASNAHRCTRVNFSNRTLGRPGCVYGAGPRPHPRQRVKAVGPSQRRGGVRVLMHDLPGCRSADQKKKQAKKRGGRARVQGAAQSIPPVP